MYLLSVVAARLRDHHLQQPLEAKLLAKMSLMALTCSLQKKQTVLFFVSVPYEVLVKTKIQDHCRNYNAGGRFYSAEVGHPDEMLHRILHFWLLLLGGQQ